MLAIDLYCGLGGWTEGLLASGWEVVGFDNERHCYGNLQYPAQLVIQDVTTLNGSQFKDAGLIVASPPCQEYSYMAMPWGRAKQIERALLEQDEFPERYNGSRTLEELNELFNACFRIQREAIEAAGKYIPLVVENVRGAQKWVGQADWHYGSYYLWGDIPALMPMVTKGYKSSGMNWSDRSKKGQDFTMMAGKQAIKQGGDWFSTPGSISRTTGGRSPERKMASAMIAKVPFELSRHIGEVYA